MIPVVELLGLITIQDFCGVTMVGNGDLFISIQLQFTTKDKRLARELKGSGTFFGFNSQFFCNPVKKVLHSRPAQYILSDSDVFPISEPDVKAFRHARHLPDTDGDMIMKKVKEADVRMERGLSLADPSGVAVSPQIKYLNARTDPLSNPLRNRHSYRTPSNFPQFFFFS